NLLQRMVEEFGLDGVESLWTEVSDSTVESVSDPSVPRAPGSRPHRYCHSLQPARHLVGRDAILDSLKGWLTARSAEQPNVIAVVAAGGMGKTALVERFLREFPADIGLFVWSMYEQPAADRLFDSLRAYFGLERLQ